MGQAEINSSLKKNPSPSLKSFTFETLIGKGCIGKVWKVSLLKQKATLALKEMSKDKIICKGLLDNIFQEKEILLTLYHPFIVNMYCTFQDENYLYMLIDYLPCKDLRYNIKKLPKFNEAQLKFITACVIEGLEYIHSNNIVHRDIKPDNIICDDKGYVRITDFGVAKKLDWNSFYEVSGTTGYMAPEVFNHKRKIFFESDFFSLGVMLYEIIMNKKPYGGRSGDDFGNEDKVIDNSKMEYSEVCCDFINKLLIRDYKKRLGCNGINELKEHPWLTKIEWKHLHYKTMQSPLNFKECLNENKEVKTTDKYQIDMALKSDNNNNQNNNDNSNFVEEEEFQKQFEGYNCMHFLSQSDIQKYNMRTINKSTLSQRQKYNKHLKLKTIEFNSTLYPNNKTNNICSNNGSNGLIYRKKQRKSLNVLLTNGNEIHKNLLLNTIYPSSTSIINSHKNNKYSRENLHLTTKVVQNNVKLPIISNNTSVNKLFSNKTKGPNSNSLLNKMNKFITVTSRNSNLNPSLQRNKSSHVNNNTLYNHGNMKPSPFYKDEVSINTTTSSNSSSSKYKLKGHKNRSTIKME